MKKKCMFCEIEKNIITELTRVGKKQICDSCMVRLINMLGLVAIVCVTLEIIMLWFG